MSANIEEHVESAIRQVERLYEHVTGQSAPAPGAAPYAEIPAEHDPARYVEQQMERLLHALGGGPVPDVPRHEAPTWVPPISIWAAPDRYLICVDLPGVPRSSLQISVAEGVLEIAGERPAPLETVRGAELRWTERPGGRFRRVVALPVGANTSEMRASIVHGVLELTLPRLTTPQPVAIG
ncbi:MAG TPA: Hsp20/alpha crystallin family protein [Sandaracinaceae bacterium]